jgi:hypothetical protein
LSRSNPSSINRDTAAVLGNRRGVDRAKDSRRTDSRRGLPPPLVVATVPPAVPGEEEEYVEVEVVDATVPAPYSA